MNAIRPWLVSVLLGTAFVAWPLRTGGGCPGEIGCGFDWADEERLPSAAKEIAKSTSCFTPLVRAICLPSSIDDVRGDAHRISPELERRRRLAFAPLTCYNEILFIR